MTSAKLPESFVADLRRALRGLYDPAVLRRSPLLAQFGLEHSHDTVLALRGVLLKGIESLRPDAGAPLQSAAWRVYRILNERYIEQFGQEDVASHLGVGTRQVRRQESEALQMLAERLWKDHDLAAKADTAQMQEHDDASLLAARTEGPAPDLPTASRQQELALLESYPTDVIAAKELVTDVLRLLAPLTQTLNVEVCADLPDHLPHPIGRPAIVRQALSNLLTVAISVAPGGGVTVSLTTYAGGLAVLVRSTAAGFASPGLDVDAQENLQVAQELAQVAGCSLEVAVPESGSPAAFEARLAFPAVAQVDVLVIDDNADALLLIERYLEGTRYRCRGTTHPEEALQTATRVPPDIILLDVMLPGMDGWEVLGRLRQHPFTAGVPVVISTILAQEQLALTLGAAAFLRKPVTRESLLVLLDQHAP